VSRAADASMKAFVSAPSFLMLCAVAALWQCAEAQLPAASNCSACVAINGASIYSNSRRSPGKSSKLLSTGIGAPTVVWCSAQPTGDEGTCSNTSFIVANLQTQCSGWTDPAQVSPCPAAAPFAFFQSCDCTRSCKYQGLAFDKFSLSTSSFVSVTSVQQAYEPQLSVVNLLRSCELCVAAGGEWWSASDLKSTACSNITVSGQTRDESHLQTVIPSCHAAGERFWNGVWGLDFNPFEPAFRYSTSYQCSQGSSSCSSIRVPGGSCVAMIVLLVNMPFTALFSRVIRKWCNVEFLFSSNPDIDTMGWKWLGQYVLGHSRNALVLIEFAFESKCSATTPRARRRNLVAKFLVTYIFWPIAVALAFAVPALAIFILLQLLPFLLLYKFFLFIKACWVDCGGENRSDAHSSEVHEGVAMSSIANLQHVDHSEFSLEQAQTPFVRTFQ
jgi:hypothetical protein